MNIVQAKREHIPKLTKLFDAYRQFYHKPADEAGCEAYLSRRMEQNESVVFVVEDTQGELLGFTQLYASFCSVEMAPLVTLYDLFVHPSSRRQGVGTALMERAERYARESGADRVRLETHFSNTMAQALYEQRGWVKDKEFFTYTLSCT